MIAKLSFKRFQLLAEGEAAGVDENNGRGCVCGVLRWWADVDGDVKQWQRCTPEAVTRWWWQLTRPLCWPSQLHQSGEAGENEWKPTAGAPCSLNTHDCCSDLNMLGRSSPNNNNNNNSTAIFMVLSSWRSTIARVHPVHLMNADWAPGGRQPSDQANRLGLWVRR